MLMAKTKVGLAYRSTRRNWVKLWTHEWLRGTSRFELTPSQRSAFVDLLAMAGDSKVPGKVCAGLDADGSILGFPLSYISGVLTMAESELEQVLEILAKQGRIESTTDPRGNWIITLTSWERYQSEYHRQKSYRSNSTEVTGKVTTEARRKLPVEGEVEGDGEEEKSSKRLDDLKHSYLAKCQDPEGMIAAIVEIVCERATKSGVKIRTEAYIQKAVESFDTQVWQDREELQRRLKKVAL
jgi:hypothetical protein